MGEGERAKGMRRRSLLSMARITRGSSRRGVNATRWSGFGGLIRVISALEMTLALTRLSENENERKSNSWESLFSIGEKMNERWKCGRMMH